MTSLNDIVKNPLAIIASGAIPGGQGIYRAASDINNILNANQPVAQPAAAANNTVVSSARGGSAPVARAAVGGGGASSADLALIDDQTNQLRNLLGRTDTLLSQGLTNNQDEYNRNVGGAQAAKEKQYATFEDSRLAQNESKLDAYNTLNRNAGNGYRSLAQIIGRSAGTGSSAFQELLPDVIGKDTSSKRQDITETSGRNLANIDKSQKQYDLDFSGVLDDLERQRKTNESSIRSGIETQRQNINGQLASVAGQRAQAAGGGSAQIRAAQAPFQSAIDNSRNAVESFFNQFRTAYTPRQAVAATPDLANYTVDRSAVNANGVQGVDATNPYSALLRKKLQGAL